MFGDNGGLGDIGITLGGESDGIGGENSSSNIIISTTTSETFATALAADVSDTTITNANNVTGAATTATAAASTSTAAATTAADSAANQCQCDGRGTCSYCRAKSAENRGLFSGGKPESLSISGKANAAGVLIGGAAAAVGIGAVMGPQMKKMLKKMLKNGKGASSKKIAAAGAAETEVPDWEPTPGEEIKGDSFFKKAKSDTYFGNF